MSHRYSDEAMAKKHAKGRQIFLDQAKEKYGGRFDYSRVEFVTQKVKVTIGCPDHGWFKISPDSHLRCKMGCTKCGDILRGKNKSETSRQEFFKKFEKRHGGRLKLVTDYRGATSPIVVECLKGGHQLETTPDNLNHYFKEGCTICANEARWQAQVRSQEEIIQEAQDKFPDFDFSQTQYKGMRETFSFICPEHGEQTRNYVDFIRSHYGCPACGNEQVGYAGYRIRRLMSDDPLVKSRPTRIALMKMNIWGIETYKLGVTTRTLRARYKEFHIKVYYEAVLDELDALMLEHLLHSKYRDDHDPRVKYKGMRDGKRWAGDEELYFRRALKPMLADLKFHVQALSKNDPHYWNRFPELELPDDKPREIIFTEGEYNQPRPVICLDNKKIYPSATEAARKIIADQTSLSSVCRGERATVKGLHFAYLDDYEAGSVPPFIPSKKHMKQVRCIDTGEVFSSMREAGRAKGILSASKISMVCMGKRKTCGGLRWEYVEST